MPKMLFQVVTLNVVPLHVVPLMVSILISANTANATDVDYLRDVKPLLEARCYSCHAAVQQEGGLRLDTGVAVRRGGDSGAAVQVHRPAASLLVERVTARDPDVRMPPEGPSLTLEQISTLRSWIQAGASSPPDERPQVHPAEHWAFQPPQRPSIPPVVETDWVRTPVDAFILSRLEQQQLVPSPPADRRTLIRRLHLDLLGLPPSPTAVKAFVDDTRPDAYDRLVDRLLASPHYGERWGRYWLDLARWAESNGFQHNIPRLYAWRYRDYVVDSFNTDKPFDDFLKQQVAGDEIHPRSDENLIATGFLAGAQISGNQLDARVQRNDILVDIVNTTASAVLGLTMRCAQCHDHKFDPITQRDYYRFQGFFVKGQIGNLALEDPQTPNPTDWERWVPATELARYRKEAKGLKTGRFVPRVENPMFTRPHTWGYYSPATGVAEVDVLPFVCRRPFPFDRDQLMQTKPYMLVRGDPNQQGSELTPGWPEFLEALPNSATATTRTSLADWFSHPENPLVARVWVNRLWQHHFGRGLVSTPSDFGLKGTSPTHPMLLDWLATELSQAGLPATPAVRDGRWSTKRIHRLILLSSTYRQASRSIGESGEQDPDNHYLSRWRRRRLEAEAIRDSVLAVSGGLDLQIGGPGQIPAADERHLRRTVYLYHKRGELSAMQAVFDGAAARNSCARRGVSTVALQPLYLLNSDFMLRRADDFAARILRDVGDGVDHQIRHAWLCALSREPDESEFSQCRKFLQRRTSQLKHAGAPDAGRQALAQLCHALFNLNEFVYLP